MKTFLATLGDTGLYVAGNHGVEHKEWAGGGSFGEILNVASSLNIRELWIHQSFEPRLYPTIISRHWDIQPIPGAQLAHWYHAYLPGTHGDGIDLAFAAHGSPGSGPSALSRCPDAASLLSELMALNAALGYNYHRTPGGTGMGLLREVHGGGERDSRHWTRLDTTYAPPPPAVEGEYGPPAGDFEWIRPLTEAEHGMRFAHIFDRNKSYLAGAGVVECGLGAWEHWEFDHLGPDTHLYPGYYRIEGPVIPTADWPLPSPLDPHGWHALHPRFPHWVMAPALQCAMENGYDVHVTEAYVWPVHSRVLEPWAKRLRDADQMLAGFPYARAVIKQIYTQSITWLNGSWNRAGDARIKQGPNLYRPEWRHGLIAMSTANIWRAAQKVANKGGHVVAIYQRDAMMLLSDSELPAELAESVGLKLGTTPGLWKIKRAAIPLADIADCFDIVPAQIALNNLDRRLSVSRIAV